VLGHIMVVNIGLDAGKELLPRAKFPRSKRIRDTEISWVSKKS
jgi:hypothetical protein